MTLLPATAILGAALIAPLPAPPVPVPYKLIRTAHETFDLSVVDEGIDSTRSSTSAFLRLALGDSADARVVHVVIDSMQQTGGWSTEPNVDAIAHARGATYHFVLEANGAVRSADEVVPGGDLVQPVLNALLDALPHASTAPVPGRSWSDTTELLQAAPRNSRVIRTVTNYLAPDAREVRARFAASHTGVQSWPEGETEISGSSTGQASWTFDASGQLAGLTRHEDASFTYAIPNVPKPARLTTSDDIRLTRLP